MHIIMDAHRMIIKIDCVLLVMVRHKGLKTNSEKTNFVIIIHQFTLYFNIFSRSRKEMNRKLSWRLKNTSVFCRYRRNIIFIPTKPP